MPSEFFSLLAFVFLKYALMFGVPYLIFWKFFPALFRRSKIQLKERAPTQALFEIKYSMVTVFLQGCFLFSVLWLQRQGRIQLYPGFASHGYWTEVLAFIGYFVVYDTYFYWSHRLLHWGWFYRKVHVVHHRSLNPTPLASYSFHPVEAVLSLIYFYPVLFLFPMSQELFLALLLLTDIGNLAGHLGYDLLPRFMWKGWVTTPTHHNMHHQFSRCNFGLYWGGWDQIFRTLHPKTREEFYRIKDQA